MFERKHVAVLVTALAFMVAQPAGAQSAGARQSGASRSQDAELAEITAYRLTMAKIDQWMAAQRNVARAVAAMSPAERRAFKAQQEGGDDDMNIAGMARRIDQVPLMAKAVRAAGLTSREFAVLSMSVVQSGMAAAVLQMRPKDNPDSLVREMKANMANVRFMRENEAVLRQKQQALAAELKAANVEDDDEPADDEPAPDEP